MQSSLRMKSRREPTSSRHLVVLLQTVLLVLQISVNLRQVFVEANVIFERRSESEVVIFERRSESGVKWLLPSK